MIVSFLYFLNGKDNIRDHNSGQLVTIYQLSDPALFYKLSIHSGSFPLKGKEIHLTLVFAVLETLCHLNETLQKSN